MPTRRLEGWTRAALLNLLIILSVFAAASLALDADLEEELSLKDEAKPCRMDFNCWRSEPVIDGVPLALYGRHKRISIGLQATRGAKCRCRNFECSFYDYVKRTHLACQEF